MAIRVGINGFGRIGRLVFRAICDQGLLGKEIDVVAVNDIVPADNLAYLLKYDSTPGQVRRHGHAARSRAPALPKTTCWSSTATRSSAWPSRTARPRCRGRPWASISSSSRPACSPTPRRPRATSTPAPRRSSSRPPAKNEDITIVLGVNDDKYDPAKHNIISNASCTTNCLAPVVHVLLKEGFGIEEGLMTTIHSYTATQKTVDGPSKKDWKGGRTAAINIIPSTTGAAKAVGLVIPEVKGKLTGMSFRVPTPTVSVVDLTVKHRQGDQLRRDLRGDEEGQRDLPQGHPRLHRRTKSSRSDFIHDAHSSIFDAGSGIELNKQVLQARQLVRQRVGLLAAAPSTW